MTRSALLHSHSIAEDRFTIYPDIEWQQFQLIQAGFAKFHDIRLSYSHNTI